MASHEPLRAHRKTAIGSNRSFGLVFALIFALFGTWSFIWRGEPLRWWLLILSALFLTTGFVAPHWLAPLNRAWFRFGLLLHKIISPLIMGLLFFGSIVPVAWILRRKGVDLLRLRCEPEEDSYWIQRSPPGPMPGTFTKQF
jgi:hypothetical protein